MGILTIVAAFAVTLAVALIWGLRWAYVVVFLPALIFLNQVPGYNLQHAPVTVPFAPMYALVIALPFVKDKLRFRWCWTDTVVVLLMWSAAVTGWTTEFAETGVNALRNDTLRLALPYFFGRIVFQDWQMRRATLWLLVASLAFISFCALCEAKFTPYFYLHLLQKAGMNNPIHTMAYARYGIYRVAGPTEHPIFFGNMNVIFLGMVVVLAKTSGVRLTNPWVALAMVAAVGCTVLSVSFTPYMGLLAGTCSLAVLMLWPLARRMVLPLTLLGVSAMWGYTYYMAHSPVLERQDGSAASANGFAGSMNTRRKIIQQSWPLVTTAGPFGYGLRPDFSDAEGFDLASVDNSYMQFTMTHGWVYTGLWICIGVTFAARAGKAFRRVTDPRQVFPLVVCTSTVLGLMVSMYTVWAGAVYAVVWIVMLALSQSLVDAVLNTADATAGAGVAAGRVGPLRPPVVRFGGRQLGYGA